MKQTETKQHKTQQNKSKQNKTEINKKWNKIHHICQINLKKILQVKCNKTNVRIHKSNCSKIFEMNN